MKKFVNDPGSSFASRESPSRATGTLKYEPKYNLIYRADIPKKDLRSSRARAPGTSGRTR